MVRAGPARPARAEINRLQSRDHGTRFNTRMLLTQLTGSLDHVDERRLYFLTGKIARVVFDDSET